VLLGMDEETGPFRS